MATFIDDTLGVGTLTTDSKVQIVEDLALEEWVQQIPSSNLNWEGIEFGNGVWVAVSANGSPRQAMRSTDGINWTEVDIPLPNRQWQSLAFGNGVFCAVAFTGTNTVITSPDGITWTDQTQSENSLWNTIIFGNNQFVAFGDDNDIMTSPDGINWTTQSGAQGNFWTDAVFGAGLYVAVSLSTGGGINQVQTSPDGITWTSQSAATVEAWSSVTFGNGLFVAVSGTFAGNTVMTSPDGINWTTRVSADPTANWHAVTFGNNQFVATAGLVGTAGFFSMTSPDGINWTLKATPADNIWDHIGFSQELNQFVSVASGGTGDRAMTLETNDLSDKNAVLKLDSTTSGFLQPRLTTVQRDGINSPFTGLMIFNITTLHVDVFDGTEWRQLNYCSC